MIDRIVYRRTEFNFKTPLEMLNDDLWRGTFAQRDIVNIVSHDEDTADEVLVVYYKE